MNPLTRSIVKGAFWTYGTSLVVLVAQLLYTGVTSRLVDPAGFGAYATAQALAGLISYFTLASLGSAVTRAPHLSREQAWTAVLMALGGGAAGAAVLWLFAPVWASLWASPGSVDVIRALGLLTAASPLVAVLVGLLRREMRLRYAALMESSGAVFGMLVGLLLVSQMHDAEALALGLGAGALATATLAAASGLGLGPPRVSRNGARYLLSFSSQVSVQNLLYFTVNTAPTWLVSRVVGPATLGQYSRANLIVGLPFAQLSAGSMKSLYPGYARVQDDPARMRAAVTDALTAVSGISFVLFGGLVGTAPVTVPLLLGPQWAQATSLVPEFGLSAALTMVFVVLSNAFEAKAMLRSSWRVQGVLILCTAAALVATLQCSDVLPAAALSLGIGYGGAHVYQLVLATRAGLVEGPRILQAYSIHAACGLTLAGSLWLTTSSLRGDGTLASLVGAAVVTGSVATGTWLLREQIPLYTCARQRGLLDWRTGVTEVSA